MTDGAGLQIVLCRDQRTKPSLHSHILARILHAFHLTFHVLAAKHIHIHLSKAPIEAYAEHGGIDKPAVILYEQITPGIQDEFACAKDVAYRKRHRWGIIFQEN